MGSQARHLPFYRVELQLFDPETALDASRDQLERTSPYWKQPDLLQNREAVCWPMELSFDYRLESGSYPGR